MRHSPFLIALVTILLLIAGFARSQSQSAADLYRVAAAAVPTSQPSVDPLTIPLDASTTRLLESSARALDLFDVASTMPFGAWGFKAEDPFSASATLPNALPLADVVVVRARMRISQRQGDQAVNDLFNLLQLARRLSITPSLTRQRLQNDLIRKAIGGIGLILPDLSPQQVSQLASRLVELRSPIDPAEALQADARAYLWYHRCIYEDITFANLIERRPAMAETMIGSIWKPASVEDLWDNPVSFDLVMVDTERAFEDLSSALKLSEPHREIEFGSAIARSASQHPLVRNASTLALIAVQQSHTQDTMMDLLKAALRIGSEAQRPFMEDEVRRLAGNYRVAMADGGLELAPPGSDATMVLRVGRTPATQPTTSTTEP